MSRNRARSLRLRLPSPSAMLRGSIGRREAIDREHTDEALRVVVLPRMIERHNRAINETRRVARGRRIARSSGLVPITITITVAPRLSTSTTAYSQNDGVDRAATKDSYFKTRAVGRSGSRTCYAAYMAFLFRCLHFAEARRRCRGARLPHRGYSHRIRLFGVSLPTPGTSRKRRPPGTMQSTRRCCSG